MTSRRETLMRTIQGRLEAIIGDDTYYLCHLLRSVQRWVHSWYGQEHLVNMFGELPTIIVRAQEPMIVSETVDLWLRNISIDIGIFLESPSDDSDVCAALADVERALFVGDTDGFGVGFRNWKLSNQTVDPENGMPLDGIHVTLSGEYQEQIGAPGSGE